MAVPAGAGFWCQIGPHQAAWGEPIGVAGNMPAWQADAGNSAADQAVQMGMHHDGIHFYPLDGSRRGLLAMNHEYTDDGLLHTDGQKDWTPRRCASRRPRTACR
jgi:secreted PhoX family phosphatase